MQIAIHSPVGSDLFFTLKDPFGASKPVGVIFTRQHLLGFRKICNVDQPDERACLNFAIIEKEERMRAKFKQALGL